MAVAAAVSVGVAVGVADGGGAVGRVNLYAVVIGNCCGGWGGIIWKLLLMRECKSEGVWPLEAEENLGSVWL